MGKWEGRNCRGLYLLLARTINDMGLPDRAIENPKLRSFVNFCFNNAKHLQAAGDATHLGRQKLGTLCVQDFLHSFDCMRSVANEACDFFMTRYGKVLPFCHCHVRPSGQARRHSRSVAYHTQSANLDDTPFCVVLVAFQRS
jgi:hypothetical protein